MLDNNNALAIVTEAAGRIHKIEALAASPDKQDSLNCSYRIADEIHATAAEIQPACIREEPMRQA